jgi:hypothetical protein
VAACRAWLDAWSDVLHLLDRSRARTISEFDDRFRGSQSLFNWIQEFEAELWNAGLEDRQFLSARIAVCEEGLRRFRAAEDLLTENRRRALAESYFELGYKSHFMVGTRVPGLAPVAGSEQPPTNASSVVPVALHIR